MLCSLVKINQYFRRTYHLHLQGQRARQARNKQDAGSKLCLIPEGGGGEGGGGRR
jgi:hypothetical protein